MSSTNITIKPQILYNKPPNTKLLSSETPSCTIANSFMTQPGMTPPGMTPGMIPDNMSEEDKQSDKLGYWGNRHLYPFGHPYRHMYPYRNRGFYGYPCYRGYGRSCGYGGIYSYLW